MRINHNVAALNTYRQLSTNGTNQQKSIAKLSSGLRINSAADDAAGLAISEKMRGQIRGLEMASKNAQDGISLIQTAEGALNETHSILQRMRELAVQAANDTNNGNDRKEIQKEINQLIEELDRISTDTEFNTKTLLDGSLTLKLDGELTNTTYADSVKVTDVGDLTTGATIDVTQTVTYDAESTTGANDGEFQKIVFEITVSGASAATVAFSKADLDGGTTSKEITIGNSKFAIDVKDASALATSTGNGAVAETSEDSLTLEDNSLTFHIGANDGQKLKLGLSDMSSTALKVNSIDVTTQANADAAIKTIQEAIDDVSSERSKLGAYQNRLEHTINNLSTSSENLTAAESRIRDVDMAKEMMEFTKNNILSQAAQAMLAQANQQPQGVLQLLR